MTLNLRIPRESSDIIKFLQKGVEEMIFLIALEVSLILVFIFMLILSSRVVFRYINK
jgi:hypothetical protein